MTLREHGGASVLVGNDVDQIRDAFRETLIENRIMIRRLRRLSVSRKGAKTLRVKTNIAQLCGIRMNFEPALNDSILCIGSKF